MSRGGKKKGGERTLTQELAAFLSNVLVPDLRERAKAPEVHKALEKRYLHEKAANRTAEHFIDWVERTVEQVGAAWVLSCVFIRTLEDRELLGQRRLAGPGAKDAYGQFIELAPALTARDYLLIVFREVASLPAAEDVLGPKHNPAWRLSPSHEAARKLLDFLQEEDAGGALKWTFTGTDTRFLGDLYQDLSEEVRKRYALLQTPHFVEKFILDLTLEPAIEEFGVEEVRLIDPTCGSGHFLLGAFERLFEKRRLEAPGVDVKEHVRAALAQIYGVDLNPYAVAIARFRLTLAYLEKAGVSKLAHAPRLPLNLVVADSLLYGGRHQKKLSDLDVDRSRWGDEIFDLEDPDTARRVFGQQYHAVVGNPPYIQCEDDALRDAYRDRYISCYRAYALAAPFTERFFELAVERGFVGLINANSFMKRGFGKKLIEDVLPRFELSRVIDTSGAYIPGHGTPTVLLFGRNQAPMRDSVSAVLGKRAEPATPDRPENGLVWSAIEAHYDSNSFENDFISVMSLPRSVLSRHPWSLGGGGATELKEQIEAAATMVLGDVVDAIGRTTVCGEDDAWILPRGTCKRMVGYDQAVPFVMGESVRDWAIDTSVEVIFPYMALGGQRVAEDHPVVRCYLWKYRALFESRTVFGKTLKQKGSGWYEHLENYKEKLRTPLFIAFGEVATHNHFAFDRGGKVFNRTAPVIKLPPGATEDEYLSLLGYLNSSAACFWMKQVFPSKHSAAHKTHPDPVRNRYVHASEGLKALPVPAGVVRNSRLCELSLRLSNLAVEQSMLLAEASFFKAIEQSASGEELKDRITGLWRAADDIRERMIVLQEEIDWSVYAELGLASADLLFEEGAIEAVCPRGVRPFERIVPRKSYVRERSESVVLDQAEVPPVNALSPQLEDVWARRVCAIRESAELGFLEQPLFKRQWRDTDDNISEFQYRDALMVARCEDWVALRLEEEFACARDQSFVKSARALAGRISGLPGLSAVVECILGSSGTPEELLKRVFAKAAVPFLSALRMTESGISKRKEWEAAWDGQRAEDAGHEIHVSIPPHYESDDFVNPQFWKLRGALDVPKERFIVYPGITKDDDQDVLVGWAGWNQLEQATALAALCQERKTVDGWESERLVPLLAGLLELVPWLQQWHNEPNADFNGERLGDYYAQFVMEEARSLGLTLDDLRNWRPTKAAAKKRATKKKAAASDTEDAA